MDPMLKFIIALSVWGIVCYCFYLLGDSNTRRKYEAEKEARRLDNIRHRSHIEFVAKWVNGND